MIVLYGLFKYTTGEFERSKVATFSSQELAEKYVELSETKTSKKIKWNLRKKFYQWSLLNGFNAYEILYEDVWEIPHDPSVPIEMIK